jgi:pimeloyl-ACP methyl ester carboxylesterase
MVANFWVCELGTVTNGRTDKSQGSIAVPKEDLPKTLRVQTRVNGELRQDSTSDELIFSIPQLIAAMSAGQTLQPGDVIATGTPAGVGIGRKPPVFLKPGDEIQISVTGLGTLTNRVAQRGARNETISRVAESSAFELTNGAKTATTGARDALLRVNGKLISYTSIFIPGNNTDDENVNEHKEPIIFVHGLGGTKDYWRPLIMQLSRTSSFCSESRNYHIYDLEGHGHSPTHPLSTLTVPSLATDLFEIAVKHAGVTPSNPATVIAHCVGSLVAMRFAQDCPSLVRKLVLMGPPDLSILRPPRDLPVSLSLSESLRSELVSQAALARTVGMQAVAAQVMVANLFPSPSVVYNNVVGVTAMRLSVLSQDPEGYAKACQAFASAEGLSIGVNKETKVLIITNPADRFSPVESCMGLKDCINHMNGYSQEEEGNARFVAQSVIFGHWYVFDNPSILSEILENFLV